MLYSFRRFRPLCEARSFEKTDNLLPLKNAHGSGGRSAAGARRPRARVFSLRSPLFPQHDNLRPSPSPLGLSFLFVSWHDSLTLTSSAVLAWRAGGNRFSGAHRAKRLVGQSRWLACYALIKVKFDDPSHTNSMIQATPCWLVASHHESLKISRDSHPQTTGCIHLHVGEVA